MHCDEVEGVETRIERYYSGGVAGELSENGYCSIGTITGLYRDGVYSCVGHWSSRLVMYDFDIEDAPPMGGVARWRMGWHNDEDNNEVSRPCRHKDGYDQQSSNGPLSHASEGSLTGCKVLFMRTATFGLLVGE